jgi:hypothetical protein
MAIGSVALWTVVPLGALWLAAHLPGSPSQLSETLALVALGALSAGVAAGVRVLSRVEDVYLRLPGVERKPRPPAWRRSLTDTRSASPGSVLDTVMVAAVFVAGTVFVGWLLLFAGSPLPA